ncbi:MAG: AtpZ/AtpI family protein [Candidatus Nanopelagicales bacterium]|jgi:F0F1-type ATP synthase assembly protein I
MASKDVADTKAASPNETAWMITGRLLAGMLLYGAVGWLLGRWLGHEALFIAGGILFGMAASLYLVLARLNQETHELKRSNQT